MGRTGGMSRILTRNRLIGLALAVLIAVLDQASKWFVTERLKIDSMGDQMELLPFFDLTYTRNYGISLGMLEATSMEMRWILVALTGAIALVVAVWMMREKLLADILGLGLILGGALGNIYDRYHLGYVTDFADFHIGGFRPFLIFNVADAAITIGVVLILARALFVGDREDDRTQQTGGDAAAVEN
jgi:signal peptidase II